MAIEITKFNINLAICNKIIDFIEELDGRLTAYEFKWKKTNAKMPKAFSDNYPNTDFQVISPENYIDFISAAPKK